MHDARTRHDVIPTLERFVVRPMKRTELDLAVQLAEHEGWNPGLHDAECFWTTDPGGYFVGCLDGEPIATLSAVKYGPGFGFVGLYIVKEEFRGRGYGYRLWRVGLQSLGDRLIGLDGVVAQQEFYRTSGFRLAHRNVRYGGVPALDGSEVPGASGQVGGSGDTRVVDVQEVPLERLINFDRPYFPAPRDTFLWRWLDPSERIVRVLVQDNKITGYGVARACARGHKIGPLVAESPAGADHLFTTLAAAAGGGEVFLDTPEPNAEAWALAERHGLVPVFETARMYTGPIPTLPFQQIFGITTFELG